MPEVGLFTAAEPLKRKYRVSIHYSVHVEDLAVYNESYDVDTLREELASNPEAAATLWLRRLEAPCIARELPEFSASLTHYLAEGTLPKDRKPNEYQP